MALRLGIYVRTVSWAVMSLAVASFAASETPPASTRPNASTETLSREANSSEIFESVFGRRQFNLTPIPYPVIIEGANSGDILVKPGRDGSPASMDRQDIFELLFPLLTDQKIYELKQTTGADSSITTSELTSLGLPTRFDPATLTLVVDVPLESRSIVPIALRRRVNPAASLTMQPPATFSALLNVLASAGYVHKSDFAEPGFETGSVNMEAAVNYRGTVFETGLRFTENTDDQFKRADTRLTRDFVDRTLRIEAGDLRVPLEGLQGRAGIAGIAASRNFDTKPYEEFRTNPSQQFELQRDARVSVYINNQLVRELRLRPGRYSLTDLPLRSAAGNDVVLEILYDTGEVERVVFAAFYEFDLLKAGVSDFAFSAGPRADIVAGERDYELGNTAFSGFYRYGVNDRLTLGINTQGDRNLFNLGVEGLISTSVGSFGGLAAISNGRSETGSALTAFYRWNGTNIKRRATFDVQASVEDQGFTALGNERSTVSYEYDIAGRLAFNLGEATRFQVSNGFRRLHEANEGEQTWSTALNRRMPFGTLSATLRYDEVESEPEVSAGLSYTFRFGPGSAQLSYDSLSPSYRAAYSRSPSNAAGSFGYDVDYIRQAGTDEIVGGVNYIANRFDSRLEQRIGRLRDDSTFGAENRTNVFFGTALVHADGRTALSRPVFDSFAIFDVGDGADEFEISVDPQSSASGDEYKYAAKSSMFGPAVVPDLQSYLVRTIAVDAPDAPPGTSLGGAAVSLQPGYRSGYVVTVGDDRNVAVVSQMIDIAGQPIVFAAAYAVFPDGTETPIFTNAGGRFYLEGARPGEKIQLRFDDPPDLTASIELPEDVIGLVRLETPVIAYPTSNDDEVPRDSGT